MNSHSPLVLETLTNLTSRNFLLCDIGARGELPAHWKILSNKITSLLFEADPEEAEVLAQNKSVRVIPYALGGHTEMRTLYLTKARRCSSLLAPNFTLLKKFPNSERFNIDKEIQVATTTMDQLYKDHHFEHIDFIKIDTQGTELEILKSSGQVLKRVLGIEVEVEFQTMYKNQPLFRDVDSFLDSQDFELLDLRKTYWKSNQSKGLGSSKGLLMFGDALYLKKINTLFDLCENNRADAANTLLNYVFITLVYGVHDQTYQLLADERCKFYFNDEQQMQIKAIINLHTRSLSSFFQYRMPSPWLSKIFYYLFNMFRACENGWVIAENQLGSRKVRGVELTQ